MLLEQLKEKVSYRQTLVFEQDMEKAKKLDLLATKYIEIFIEKIKERALRLSKLDPEAIHYIMANAKPHLANIEKAESVLRELLKEDTQKLASEYSARVLIEVLAANKKSK